MSVASAQGLDVSNFQGRFDWAGTKGLSFGINRVTQGLGAGSTNSPDPEAGWNHTAIRAAGLHRGVYHFLDPFLSGTAQAHYLAAELGKLGHTATDMLWCDSETRGSSPQATAACAGAFMAELRVLFPVNPMGVYTYIDFAKTGYCAGLEHWPLWLAYPSSTSPLPPPPWIKWTFWQWGLRNGVDADAFNGTAADLDAWIASFAPAPPGGPTPFRHLTGPGDTIASLAASRGMKPGAWLEEQDKLGADTAVLAANPLPPGLVWLSVSP